MYTNDDMELNEKYLHILIEQELSRNDVKGMIDSKMNDFLKDREFKKQVRAIAADILDDFFSQMWHKKTFWKTPLKNG